MTLQYDAEGMASPDDFTFIPEGDWEPDHGHGANMSDAEWEAFFGSPSGEPNEGYDEYLLEEETFANNYELSLLKGEPVEPPFASKEALINDALSDGLSHDALQERLTAIAAIAA